MIQNYWAKMTQYKYDLFYLESYLEKSVKTSRVIKILLAVFSSGSIAAWATWQNLAFIWGFVIAASQVFSAISSYFPYQKRIKEISNMKLELSHLYYQVEKDWNDIANGVINVTEVNDICYKYKEQWETISDRYFVEDVLPHNEKCKAYAENEKDKYFKTNFGGQNNA